MQKLIWAVEDMFASPAFLAAQMGAQAATPERKGNLSEGNLHIDIRSVDQLYTALLKVRTNAHAVLRRTCLQAGRFHACYVHAKF